MNAEQLYEFAYRLGAVNAIHKFYSDDEERDDHGRWSGGGSTEDHLNALKEASAKARVADEEHQDHLEKMVKAQKNGNQVAADKHAKASQKARADRDKAQDQADKHEAAISNFK